jgi:prolipoprotein diacylglyceryl transferase
VIGYIPSPSHANGAAFNGFNLGPLHFNFYGLMIAAAVIAAAWVAQRRWQALGGFAGTITPIALWAVVFGLVGARLYSVITSWQVDTGGDPVRALEIWQGGLGIWGGVAGGVLGGWVKARRMHLVLPPLLDMAAPALPLAQAIGRWGNYFNQELFGLPSKLPWAVRITDQAQLASISPAKYRPPLSAAGTYLPGAFQPTFLYECLWDLLTFGALLLIERKVKLRRGYLFAAYAALYTAGRFWTEYLRIDPAHRYLGLRLNDWTSIGVFVVAAGVLVSKGRPKPGDELVGQPLPPELLAVENARAMAKAGAEVAGAGEQPPAVAPVEPVPAELAGEAPARSRRRSEPRHRPRRQPLSNRRRAEPKRGARNRPLRTRRGQERTRYPHKAALRSRRRLKTVSRHTPVPEDPERADDKAPQARPV